MPFRRYHRFVKRHKKGKARVYSGMSIRKLKRKMRVETPEVKTWLSGTQSTVGTGGTSLGLVAGLIRGSGPNDRIGNKIRCQRLYYNVTVTTSTGPDFYRLIIFRVKGDNLGAFPASMGEVLNWYGVSSLGAMVAPYQYDNVPSAYQIVLDKTVVLNQVAYGKQIKGHVNLHDKQTSFNGNSGVATDLGDGNYIAFHIAQNGNLAVNYTFRLEYTDV